MQVILKSDVPNLGRAGDIKIVKNGYARNYLIPKNLVLPATARSKKEQEFLNKVQESKVRKRKKTAEENAKLVDGKSVKITMKVGDEGKLFGSVTNIAIQRELEKMGFLFDKKVIIVEEPIRALGKYKIELKLYEAVSAHIEVVVQDSEGNTEFIPKVVEPIAEEIADNIDTASEA